VRFRYQNKPGVLKGPFSGNFSALVHGIVVYQDTFEIFEGLPGNAIDGIIKGFTGIEEWQDNRYFGCVGLNDLVY
jgi:hypothetical protein